MTGVRQQFPTRLEDAGFLRFVTCQLVGCPIKQIWHDARRRSSLLTTVRFSGVRPPPGRRFPETEGSAPFWTTLSLKEVNDFSVQRLRNELKYTRQRDSKGFYVTSNPRKRSSLSSRLATVYPHQIYSSSTPSSAPPPSPSTSFILHLCLLLSKNHSYFQIRLEQRLIWGREGLAPKWQRLRYKTELLSSEPF